MSQVECWECGKSYAKDEVFDIPVFKQGWTVKWCFNCAMKQLQWSDYKLVKNPAKYKIRLKRFRIKSVDDDEKEYKHRLEELALCYGAQYKVVKKVDNVWGELHRICQEIESDELEEEYGKEEKGQGK